MHAHQLTDIASVLEFVQAGNARFTLVSKATGTRFTYRVRAAEGDKPSPVSYFVSLLNGSDNESDYVYIGHIFERENNYVHGRKSRVGVDAPSAKAFAWFWRQIVANRLPDAIEVWHEGRCGRCGRTLTVPESIARGIGPECAGKL